MAKSLIEELPRIVSEGRREAAQIVQGQHATDSQCLQYGWRKWGVDEPPYLW